VLVDLFAALGASPVPMPFPEVYAALETGTVDGQENPFTNILNAKFYEVQGYLSTTRHVYNPTIVLISRKAWDGFNDEERRILENAARETRDFQRGISRAQNDDALAQLKAKGMKVSEFSPAELGKLREKVRPVIDKHSATADPVVKALFLQELEKARDVK
jgi:TRAP-type C4-dicarboxylate transport system substrate-binding protein